MGAPDSERLLGAHGMDEEEAGRPGVVDAGGMQSGMVDQASV